MVLGKLNMHMQESEVGPLPDTRCQLNPKWVEDLNVRAKAQLLEENAGHMFMPLNLAMISWI